MAEKPQPDPREGARAVLTPAQEAIAQALARALVRELKREDAAAAGGEDRAESPTTDPKGTPV